ncbi:TetR/AcrR family transcriptional regulator (plasmid) [Rhodococcus pyridinivorans]|uniref:TetR/AcrR family transcriptional regulator n=1 Tax=Rhodococcus pyridinivorans TaxID=103816 RepID=UPI001C2FE33D|nr:TetR/AcrR family transcriptional regulator [Rhodococcus pyridinivorans]QXF84448.1 TetR/AcrR family transcriptional regulator [Rhodococcus pyridinivorans]
MATTSPELPKSRRIRGLDAEQRRAQRREQILDTALELFATRGYLNTSIELLCQTAFVSTKSFYEVFAGREECALELFERTSEQLRVQLGAAMAEASDDEAAAHALLTAFVGALAEDPRRALVTFGLAGADFPGFEKVRQRNRGWAARELEELWRRNGRVGDHQRIAVAVVGGIFDVIGGWLVDADLSDTALARELVDDLAAYYNAVVRDLAPRDGGASSA